MHDEPLLLDLLINPLARGAFYGELVDVARQELRLVTGLEGELVQRGPLDFLRVRAVPGPALLRLSFVQGLFRVDGEALVPLDLQAGLLLPEDLVWGVKYRGKTHELMTQLALNLALAHGPEAATTLLDPMAGRGTTLLWAQRYGLDAWGIEQDGKAPADLTRHVRKQAKLHRIKHTLGAGGKGKPGAFVDVRFPETRLRLITGDSRKAPELLQKKRFELLVTDLPYGVQFTGAGKRNPLKVLESCAPAWRASLVPGGAAVLIYNRLLPRREALAPVFSDAGFEVLDVQLPHRMSESIERDVLVLRG